MIWPKFIPFSHLFPAGFTEIASQEKIKKNQYSRTYFLVNLLLSAIQYVI